jgi:hypothetical protein
MSSLISFCPKEDLRPFKGDEIDMILKLLSLVWILLTGSSKKGFLFRGALLSMGKDIK